MTRLFGEGKAVEVVYFSKAIDTVSHDILLEKLASHSLKEHTVHWVKNCLNGQAQSVALDGAASS